MPDKTNCIHIAASDRKKTEKLESTCPASLVWFSVAAAACRNAKPEVPRQQTAKPAKAAKSEVSALQGFAPLSAKLGYFYFAEEETFQFGCNKVQAV
ncbi:MAG: hypothetical protein AAFQ47_13770 [Pseudomonadota bacterium]